MSGTFFCEARFRDPIRGRATFPFYLTGGVAVLDHRLTSATLPGSNSRARFAFDCRAPLARRGYLRHPAAAERVYTFSKIFVSDERVTKKGTNLNHSPKAHAAI